MVLYILFWWSYLLIHLQSTYMYKHKHKYLCLPYGYNMYFLILLRPGTVNLNVFSDKTKTKLFKSKAAGQGVGRKHEYLRPWIFFKRPDFVVLCAFSGNTIACSCSMSATGAPSKALKVRSQAAKHITNWGACALSLTPWLKIKYFNGWIKEYKQLVSLGTGRCLETRSRRRKWADKDVASYIYLVLQHSRGSPLPLWLYKPFIF